jgi:hypothetical protein
MAGLNEKLEPWGLCDRLDAHGNPCGMDIESPNGVICRMPDGATLTGGKNWPIVKANARLLLLAPEMLKMIEGFREDAINELSDACDRVDEDEKARATIDAIDALFAKLLVPTTTD